MKNVLIWKKWVIIDSSNFKKKKKKQKTELHPLQDSKNLTAQFKSTCNEITYWNAVKHLYRSVNDY